ncbi:uncharacterized protein LOC106882644 [Octopus bimaculoides]|nr:uncharacterized protein LOC106882644 [Octopus bimaculoides]|eukprot:XP_014788870.1 PREDICTED: nucleolar protein 58-like [Octopus bimaculoides]
MKAKCPQKHKEEVMEREQQGEEEVQSVEEQRPVENMEEKYTVGKRKKREENTNSLPKSPMKKRKGSVEERQSLPKGGKANEQKRNEMSTKLSEKDEERKQRSIPATSTKEKVKEQEIKEDRREMTATSSERQAEKKEMETPATVEEISDGNQKETLKGKHLRTMIQYRKNVEIEKKITKMKNVIRVKLAPNKYNEGI